MKISPQYIAKTLSRIAICTGVGAFAGEMLSLVPYLNYVINGETGAALGVLAGIDRHVTDTIKIYRNKLAVKQANRAATEAEKIVEDADYHYKGLLILNKLDEKEDKEYEENINKIKEASKKSRGHANQANTYARIDLQDIMEKRTTNEWGFW